MYKPLAGLCSREGYLVLSYGATEVAPTLKDQSLYFKNNTVIHETEEKHGHGT
jgi:hypothetical protein